MLAGFDIGGTKCAVTLGNMTSDGVDIIDKKVFPTSDCNGPMQVLERFEKTLSEMTNEKPEAIGISCGGPLDSKKGIIMSPPNLPGWDNIKVVEYFEKRLGVSTYLQNDANACALAEWKFGAAKGKENVIFLTFGTGLGAGLILNGALYAGTNDNAGEVGHIRLCEYGPVGYGKKGSFEGFCSGGGIAQLGKTKALELFAQGKPCAFCKGIDDLDSINAKTVSIAADNMDEDAIDVYRQSATMLGRGLSILIDILNPQMIVIGSIYARSTELFYDEMRRVIDEETLGLSNSVCQVVPAQLRENLGDYAALSVAADGLERSK